jgi:hypothetical protein
MFKQLSILLIILKSKILIKKLLVVTSVYQEHLIFYFRKIKDILNKVLTMIFNRYNHYPQNIYKLVFLMLESIAI